MAFRLRPCFGMLRMVRAMLFNRGEVDVGQIGLLLGERAADGLQVTRPGQFAGIVAINRRGDIGVRAGQNGVDGGGVDRRMRQDR